MHDEQLRVEFNQWADAGRGASMEKGHKPTGAQAIALMGISADSRVLDVGCGNGWASRLMADQATFGRVIGIDIADRMIEVARADSAGYNNIEFQVASAEALPFPNGSFTHAFSMESIYYYGDPLGAAKEIHRVLSPGGIFAAVIDLYRENEASLQWVDLLDVPVHALSIMEYREMWATAGFTEVADRRLLDPTPPEEKYSGTSFKSHEDYLRYRACGSLLVMGRA